MGNPISGGNGFIVAVQCCNATMRRLIASKSFFCRSLGDQHCVVSQAALMISVFSVLPTPANVLTSNGGVRLLTPFKSDGELVLNAMKTLFQGILSPTELSWISSSMLTVIPFVLD
eukprot:TRINITY_DN3820_c0_g3_i2.p1 TRINITY_DN3820_c0_g3~~TRINITY_DN3820_c0_g3_i2.p1  ORF type:complete len:116 (-),score=12.08 TRINITY_DN3820_c0_g3_i2:384-731(-)